LVRRTDEIKMYSRLSQFKHYEWGPAALLKHDG